MKKEIVINNMTYQIKKNVKDALENAVLEEKITDYFDNFDYIVGDWAYGKLRLKGFNNKTNKNYKKINDIDNVENYINSFCAYGCRWFILEKVKDNKK
ncbi:MAG: YutD family protein [Bacilli bacterium]|nr:YutD family protein [Bacilli bacterium]